DGGRLRHTVGRVEVDVQHRAPLVAGHVDQHPVAQDAGVVDHGMEIAERLDSLVDEPLGAFGSGDVVGVGDCLSPEGEDLLDHLGGGARIRSPAVGCATEIVDYDPGTLAGQLERVLSPQASACAGHDGTASFAHTTHVVDY